MSNGDYRLVGVGDVAFQRLPSEALVKRLGQRRQRMREVQALLFGNLEIPLTSRGTPSDKPVAFRGPPSGAAALHRMGFDVVSLANNHALDYGAEGLEDTCTALREADIDFVGVGVGDEALRARIWEVGDSRIAFLGLCSTVPRGYAAGHGRLGVAPLRAQQAIHVDGALFDEQPGTAPHIHTWPHESDLQRAEALIQELKGSGVDKVFAAVHWGVPPMWLAPYQGQLVDYQRPMAERLIAAGVDAILGHHPHVPHSWEWIGGKPVFFSLGNFIFQPYEVEHRQDGPTTPGLLGGMRPKETREGLAVTLDYRGGELTSVLLETFVLDDEGEPTRPDAGRHSAIAHRLQALSREEGPAPVQWRPLEL